MLRPDGSGTSWGYQSLNKARLKGVGRSLYFVGQQPKWRPWPKKAHNAQTTTTHPRAAVPSPNSGTGGIKLAVWPNKGENGTNLQHHDHERLQGRQSGEWKETKSFSDLNGIAMWNRSVILDDNSLSAPGSQLRCHGTGSEIGERVCRILCPVVVQHHMIRCHSNTAVFGAFVPVDIAPSACMHVGTLGSGSGYEPGGRKFESCRAHQILRKNQPISDRSLAERCVD